MNAPADEAHGVDDTPRWPVRVLLAVYVATAAFVFVGFALHRSSVGVIGPYTPGYAAFLLVLAVALVTPAGVTALLVSALGARRGARVVLAAGIAIVAAYGVAEVVHASTRSHPFDPFVQFPGARFDHVPREAPAGVQRIVTLGGSTTHGAHLSPELRYPAVLEELLLDEGLGAEVLNAGMDWWTTKHSHINYVTYVREWQPDIAIVMHAINDLYRSFTSSRFSLGPYDEQWSHFYGPAIRAAEPKSLLGATLNRWSVWGLRHRWYARWRYRELELSPSEFRSLREFEVNLRSLVRTLHQDGLRVVLVTQPSIYRDDLSFQERANLWFPATFCVVEEGPWFVAIPSPGSMARAMEAYNAVTVRIAAETGALLVDAAAGVPRDLEHFGDDVHYTERGARRLATLVANALVSDGSLRRDTPPVPGASR